MVGRLGNRFFIFLFGGWDVCLRSWKDHLVTAHLGKWMKEQNVVTAGHNAFALKEQVSVFENRVLSRLRTGCFVVYDLAWRSEEAQSNTGTINNHADATAANDFLFFYSCC